MQVCRVLGFLTFYLMLWLTLSHSISHTAGAFQSAWGIRQGFTEEVVLRCISKDEEEYGRWIGKTVWCFHGMFSGMSVGVSWGLWVRGAGKNVK